MNMNDIAKMANVSKSTVSLVVNGKPGVSEETRKKILNLLRDNGYQRQRSVEGNNFTKTFNIGFFAVKSQTLVDENFQHLPFFDKLLNVLSQKISEMDGVLIVNTVVDNGHLKDDIRRMKRQQQIDGIIILGTEMTKEQVKAFKSVEPNLVVVDTSFPDVDCDFVSIDNFMGGVMAADHIISKGYKKIGFAGSTDYINNFLERRRGFLSELKSHGIHIEDKDFYSVDPASLSPKEGEVERIMNDKDHPEAIFCEDDYIAVRMIKSCTNLGIKVPEDIAIMGFDDIAESRIISPELTTVHVSIEDMAQISLNRLFDTLNGRRTNFNMKTFVGTSIVSRDSL